MPPLRRPERATSVQLPPREALVAGDADVLVVGGGPAGLGAAVGAASAGADVILAERYGFLGGTATAALVMPLMSFHNEARAVRAIDPTAGVRLLPGDHGPGEPVIAGVLELFLDALYAAGGAIAPSQATGYTVPFDPERFKLVALELLDDAGVRFLFHALASGVVGEGTPEGVVFETKSGPAVIRARTIVDCTGDGDVAAAAGARFELGREEDGLVQPMTLMFRLVEFDREQFADYVDAHPDQWHGVLGLGDLISEAEEAGELDLPREELLFFATPHEREVSVNSTRVSRVLGTDVWELTQAEWVSRRQMRQIAEFLRKRVPGFADAYVAQSGTIIGVRETRRIVGEYQLTAKDVLTCGPFEDAIARGSYPLDIHDPEGKDTVIRRLPVGGAYDIPLRCLLPEGVDRVLVAGRCISGTHEAHSSYRVTPIAMATGHAAGVCAAIAAATGEPPRAVDYRAVQLELIRQGANLRYHTAQEAATFKSTASPASAIAVRRRAS
jgi:FAD-dependent oxidoreductase family protein